MKKGAEGTGQGTDKDKFYRMKRGDVQFTTGGRGIAHSEQNESGEGVHFLQIWATPWKRGLTPRYHTQTFSESEKRKGFVPILSPLAAGPGASEKDEAAAVPRVEDTIPIHADLVMAAGLIGKGKTFTWSVGGKSFAGPEEEGVVSKAEGRRVYVHLAMTNGGTAKVKLDGRDVLSEGDGAYVERVNVGDDLQVESVGEAEAEVVILDSD